MSTAANYTRFTVVQNGEQLIGLRDASGHRQLKARYRAIKFGPHQTLALQTNSGWGLATIDGHWLITPRFLSLSWLSDQLVAAKATQTSGSAGHYVFFDNQGKRLPIESIYAPQPLVTSLGNNAPPAWKIYHQDPDSYHSLSGLIDAHGRVLVAVAYPFANFVYLGQGLWGVSTETSTTPNVTAVYDISGRPVKALSAFHDIQPFRAGVTTARDANDDAMLINRLGNRLAGFDALFPLYGTRAYVINPLIEKQLNRCYRQDPTQPEDSQDSTTQRICADPTLMSLARTTERSYYHAQTGHCPPEDIMALRPAYDKALNECTNAHCLASTMRRFQRTLTKAAAHCPGMQQSESRRTSISAVTQQQIINALNENKHFDAELSASDNPDAIHVTRFALGQLPAVLVTVATLAPNEPFWLMEQDSHHQWQLLLSDNSNQGPDILPAYHHGHPTLRVSEKYDAGSDTVTYYQYDGTHYRPHNQCLYTEDSNSSVDIMLCGR